MHLMCAKALAVAKWFLPSVFFFRSLSVRTRWLQRLKINLVLVTPKAVFPLTEKLSNYKIKLVIFSHSLREGNCCICSTVSSKDFGKFNTKSLKNINLASGKKKKNIFSYWFDSQATSTLATIKTSVFVEVLKQTLTPQISVFFIA